MSTRDYIEVCIESLRQTPDDVPFMNLRGVHAVAKCVNVYDGDTLWLKVNLGKPWRTIRLKCRMWGYDTSEIRGGTPDTKKLALLAKIKLKELTLGKMLLVRFGDFGMYGRPLVELYTINNDIPLFHISTSINQKMLESGHAILYHGSGEKKNARDLKSFAEGNSVDDIVGNYATIKSQISPMLKEELDIRLYGEYEWRVIKKGGDERRKQLRRRKHRKHREHSSSSGSDTDQHYHHRRRRRRSRSHSSSSSD